MKEKCNRTQVINVCLISLFACAGGCNESNPLQARTTPPEGVANSDTTSEQDNVNTTAAKAIAAAVPLTAKEHYKAGIIARDSGSASKAIEHFTAVIELDPQMTEARSQLGALLLTAERYVDASILYGRLAEDHPQDPSIRNDWGVVLTHIGNYDEAIDQFRTAIELNRDHADAHYNLATALLDTGNTAESREHLTTALRIHPAYTDAYFAFGRVDLLTGNYEGAASQFQHVMKLDREYKGLNYKLGRAYIGQGKIKKAVTHFSEAVRRNPFRPEPRFALGRALASYGNYDAAMAQFIEVARLEPENPDALFELGKMHTRSGQLHKAIAKNNAVLLLRPDWPEALNNQAWLLATAIDPKLQNPHRALELAEQAKQFADYKRPLVLDTLAAAQAATGKFKDAAATAMEAVDWAKRIGNEAMANEIQQRVDLYRANKPYHESDAETD